MKYRKPTRKNLRRQIVSRLKEIDIWRRGIACILEIDVASEEDKALIIGTAEGFIEIAEKDIAECLKMMKEQQ